MKPSIIVYNVPGGKTRFAERIAEFYGLKPCIMRPTMVVRQTDEIGFIEETRIALMREWGFEVKPFEEVAKEINAAIPLTDWRSDNPTIDGEYIAGTVRSNLIRSYWRNGYWSNFFYETSPQNFKDDSASIKCQARYIEGGVEWRGLSEEPINTKE